MSAPAAEDGYHRTLARQLRRLGLSATGPPDLAQWTKLLDAVSASYREADDDRYTLGRAIEIASEEMRELHDALSHRARHDSLTGVLNREALPEALGALLAQPAEQPDVAVLFIDLDRFKAVNDSLGHSAGDDLLIRAAHRIRVAIRDGDVVARQGGDEFVVLLSGIGDVTGALEIAHRIASQLQAPFRIGDHDAHIGASIGLTLARSGVVEIDQLLREADLAMYRAKVAGGSRCVVFDAGGGYSDWRPSEATKRPMRRCSSSDSGPSEATSNVIGPR